MQLYRGLTPLLYQQERNADWSTDVDNRVQMAVDYGKKNRSAPPPLKPAGLALFRLHPKGLNRPSKARKESFFRKILPSD